LVANPLKPNALELAEFTAQRLRDRAEVVVEDEAYGAGKWDSLPHARLEELAADLLIAFGGDGTFLSVLNRSSVPLLPVGAGTVAFLAEVEGKPTAALDRALDRLVAGDFFVEERMKLASKLADRALPDATNEVVLHTSQVAKMRLFEISVDHRPVGRVRADGVIVATPTGSTAYSLSALGPIIDPGIEAISVASLAPFQASPRAVVVDALRTVGVRLVDPAKSGVVVIDGHTEVEVPGGTEVLCYRSPRKASFVRFGSRFFGRLLGKRVLPWSVELSETEEASNGADLPSPP
jgi:NAD+ kinase